MPKRTALFPGSFDPITNGHINLLQGALTLCERLVVAVGVHPSKQPLFELAQRIAMIKAAAGPMARKAGVALEVAAFSGLVVEFARSVQATILIRGLRDGTDLDYEMQMSGMNGVLHPGLRTVFLPAGPGQRFITATLVRQIAQMGGDISAFVPPFVAAKMIKRLKEKS